MHIPFLKKSSSLEFINNLKSSKISFWLLLYIFLVVKIAHNCETGISVGEISGVEDVEDVIKFHIVKKLIYQRLMKLYGVVRYRAIISQRAD